jgi:hypothetical protein
LNSFEAVAQYRAMVALNVDFIKTDAYETASAFTKSSFLWRLNGILVTNFSKLTVKSFYFININDV